MIKSLIAASLMFSIAAPVLAQSAPGASSDTPAVAPPAPVKMKKVCRQKQGGNPLFPEMTCRSVPVETAEAPRPAPDTQVAQNAPPR